MTTPERELSLEEVPGPPLYRLVDGTGAPALEHAEVGEGDKEDEEGGAALVGALFASPDLAREFSGSAADLGFPALAGLSPEEAPTGGGYPLPEAGYVLVVTGSGTGLFHAGDLAATLAAPPAPGTGGGAELDFPLYLISDESGESPLISVEDNDSKGARDDGLLVAALFTSRERAETFRSHAAHLALPDSLGTIEDADGLRRHALVAQRAGAGYVVVDPEAGETEAIPVEELIRTPDGS